jgi:hypothetical protein
MAIDYNISLNNNASKSLIFLSWLPEQKKFEEMNSDDFFTIDDVTVSEIDETIIYSHVEEPKFYKYTPSNLSEVTGKFNFLVEITFEKVDYFKTKIPTVKKMRSIRLMTYQILSKDKTSEVVGEFDPLMSKNNGNINVRKTHTIEIRPTKILEEDCVDGKYELNLLIKEFLRDSKLDDLGI